MFEVGVMQDCPNPDPISDQNTSFSTPGFQLSRSLKSTPVVRPVEIVYFYGLTTRLVR